MTTLTEDPVLLVSWNQCEDLIKQQFDKYIRFEQWVIKYLVCVNTEAGSLTLVLNHHLSAGSWVDTVETQTKAH